MNDMACGNNFLSKNNCYVLFIKFNTKILKIHYKENVYFMNHDSNCVQR